MFLDNSNKDLENVLKETGAKVVHVNQETQVFIIRLQLAATGFLGAVWT